MMEDFLHFWGKAQSQHHGGPSVHPLAWHSLDVAAVAELLFDIFPNIAVNLAQRGKGDLATARRFLLRLIALHDIGKFSIGFQAKSPDHYPAVLEKLGSHVPKGDHCAIGHHLLNGPLMDILARMAPGLDSYAWTAVIDAVAGHHGRPTEASNQPQAEIGSAGIAAARRFALAIMALIDGAPFAGELGEHDCKLLSWQIAGFVNLADWIGSNQAVFRYQAPDRSIADYWTQIARPRAVEALRLAGLRHKEPSPHVGLLALTQMQRRPSPLQLYAESIEIPAHGPCFFLLEDMTGAGKTEAALVLAHRLMLSGRGDGLFVALPTMATANAMYRRLAEIYRRLFVPKAQPSLALAHGAARLHEGFQDSILDIGWSEPGYGRGSDADVTASAACAVWIASERRRAFFADVGVGTIDQAFLAVLPVKFAALRLLGLSRRVLIIDEAHAYQAYESEEMHRLVEFHASGGGSVIVLSATLPETVKDALAKAWCNGLDGRYRPGAWPKDYPLATRIDAARMVHYTAVAPRPDLLPRRVAVERLDGEDAALAAVRQAAASGACVAWIRNTVDDALAAQAALRTLGLAAQVFHARFAMVDRQRIEADVVRAFGAGSEAPARRGKILIATQVIEQSLDLDFDVLISDLAPMDLIIQRAGRLWRHRRGARPVSAPRLLVVAPEPRADAAADWLRRPLPGTSHVYRNHALMWQTARSLFAAGAIQSPEGVRRLVEEVYSKAALDDAPVGLDCSHREAQGREGAERGVAKQNLLRRADGYCLSSGDWSSEVQMPTRLGEERIVFRLALWEEGKLRPWAGLIEPGSSPQEVERLWASSEVAVTRRRASRRGDYPPQIERAAVALEAAWMDKGHGPVLLPLLAEGGAWRAFVCKDTAPQKNSFGVVYEPGRGVVF